ncbi:DNRLRE domain-containing protein [Streptomyces sp. W16]|nr:DNRLRE domain-containing protein [Streptomyces sp. W16]
MSARYRRASGGGGFVLFSRHFSLLLRQPITQRNRRGRARARVVVLGAGLALVASGGGAVAIASGDTDRGAPLAASEQTDRTSALASAKARDERVEITAERTEKSTAWANPDGTLTTDVFSGPIRVRENGSWTPVSTALADTGDAVTPRATVADLSFSDGGPGPFAHVADGSKALGLSLGDDLPVPSLAGDTATYADAVAGGDLVVTALPTGFSEQVVLHRRPDGPLTLRIPLTLSGGLKASQDANGHLTLTDASGRTVADAPAPHMWDSAVNEASGLAENDAKVDSRIEDTPGGQVLVLTPDTAFLNSPDVTYPLTIDPTTTLAVSTDTWLESPNYTDSQRSSDELRVGTYDSGTHRARAYLKFDTSAFIGMHIVDTDLSLYSYWSSTCSTAGSGVRVRRVTSAWDSTAIAWDDQPTVTSAGEKVNTAAHGYNTSCPAAGNHWDIDAIVQAWADGAENDGVQLRAVDESDPLTWRRYRSANYVSGDSSYEPHLTVNYRDDSELAGITDSASLTTPVVAKGTVDNSDGTAASGADVVLYAWPSNEVDDALEEGDYVKLQPVAKAVTDSSGGYELRIAALSALSAQAADDGTVNFEAIASSGRKAVSYNFGRRLVTSSSVAKVLAYSTASTAADTSADAAALQADPEDVTLTLDSEASSAPAEDSTTDATENPSATPTPVADPSEVTGSDEDPEEVEAGVSKACGIRLLKKIPPKWVIIGQTYSKTTGVAHTLSYTSGASSSLGVGVSASGTYGSYSAGGSMSKSSSTTTQYPNYGNNTGVYYKTQFRYGKYIVGCAYADPWYEVRPRSYAGGADTSSAHIPNATHCFKYIKGSVFTKTRSKAITWTNGASLTSVIGIDLSAETGYSSDTTVVYTFNKTRHLCGTGGDPGSAHPYNFVAK